MCAYTAGVHNSFTNVVKLFFHIFDEAKEFVHDGSRGRTYKYDDSFRILSNLFNDVFHGTLIFSSELFKTAREYICSADLGKSLNIVHIDDESTPDSGWIGYLRGLVLREVVST